MEEKNPHKNTGSMSQSKKQFKIKPNVRKRRLTIHGDDDDNFDFMEVIGIEQIKKLKN